MELVEDRRPLIARFTSARDVRLVSKNGAKCMWFKKGETLDVHRDLFAPAIEQGLIPVDSLEPAELKEPVVEPVTVESLARKMIEACKELIARGNPDDFTLVGQPRASSIKKLVDSHFTARDVNTAFEQAMFEVEHNGDDSKEHSEQSSVAAE